MPRRLASVHALLVLASCGLALSSEEYMAPAGSPAAGAGQPPGWMATGIEEGRLPIWEGMPVPWTGLNAPDSQSRNDGTLNPSLCAKVDTGCHVIGSMVYAKVELGHGDPVIIGGQFSIQYDPSVLDFVGVSPGATCDPTSPFTYTFPWSVDETTGELFFAVTIDPSGSDPGTQGPATMACLAFVARDSSQTEVCLFDAGSPAATLLADDLGRPVPIDNSQDCPPDVPLSTISCDRVEVLSTCTCEAGTPDCSALDTDCTEGVCSDDVGRCEALPINEGGACDDGNACTIVDVCAAGVCVGSGCFDPSLCVVNEAECHFSNGIIETRIRLGQGNKFILAGQLVIQYDPTVLDFIQISPGALCDPLSPFSVGMPATVDEDNGEIFYVVSVDPAGPAVGTQGPAAMACLTFQALGPFQSAVCLLEGVNPYVTLLSDNTGVEASFYNAGTCPADPPAISCTDSCKPIPTVSEWGLVIMALLLLSASKVRFGHYGAQR